MNSVQNPAYQTGMEARFAMAERHSRIVRILRVAVPGAVALSLAAIILVSVFNPFRMLLPKLPIDMSNLVVSGTKITMKSPHLSGYSQDRRPYEVWAKTATQDVTAPDHVELQTLRGKVLMQDQSTVTLEAVNGLMDTKQQLLELRKDIYLQTTQGYEAWLNQAFVDMGKGTVTSDEHVDVKWADGKISADKMKISGGGEIVRFDGNVVMNIDKMPQAAECRHPSLPRRRRLRKRGRSPNPQMRNDPMKSLYQHISNRRFVVRAAFAAAMLLSGEASAQSTMSGVPNAMQGFSQNRDQPIQIEAASLEMRDKKKEATFSGNVKVVQGDTTMTSKTLVVFYESKDSNAAPAAAATGKAAKSAAMQSATPGPWRVVVDQAARGQGQRGRDAKGPGGHRRHGRVRHQDQPDHHVGGVVLTQCKNVLKGDRLLVDMTTGVSRVESDSGKVQGLFINCDGQAPGGSARDGSEQTEVIQYIHEAPAGARLKVGAQSSI